VGFKCRRIEPVFYPESEVDSGFLELEVGIWMSLLKIVHYPDPVLLQVGRPVEVFDEKLKKLVDDMFDTLYEARGVGLAAPQVGCRKDCLSWTVQLGKTRRRRWC